MSHKNRRPARRPIAAVVGSGDATPVELALARTLGEALVDEGFRVVTGGLGGVMAAAHEGAHRSARYAPGDTIGVLPGYDAGEANPHCDIPIPTGLNHARNTIVAATADVVVAVGGKAGTLSELALAWTLGRPLVAVGTEGWGPTLAGRPLDDRSPHPVHGPYDPREAGRVCRRLLTR